MRRPIAWSTTRSSGSSLAFAGVPLFLLDRGIKAAQWRSLGVLGVDQFGARRIAECVLPAPWQCLDKCSRTKRRSSPVQIKRLNRGARATRPPRLRSFRSGRTPSCPGGGRKTRPRLVCLRSHRGVAACDSGMLAEVRSSRGPRMAAPACPLPSAHSGTADLSRWRNGVRTTASANFRLTKKDKTLNCPWTLGLRYLCHDRAKDRFKRLHGRFMSIPAAPDPLSFPVRPTQAKALLHISACKTRSQSSHRWSSGVAPGA